MHYVAVVFLLATAAEGLQRPKPRLVYPRLLEERSSDGRMVVHVHDDLTLNLRKASVAAPKLRVVTEEDGVTVTRFFKGADIEKDFYEDEEKIATLHVSRTEHGVQMKGLVGPHHRIAPMPTLERSEGGSVPHMIHEIEEDEIMDKHLNLDQQDHREVLNERQYRGSHPWPNTVQVEVFIVSDYRHYSYFTKTQDLLSYLCIIANGANLRLFETRDPAIKLILTGLAMSKDDKFGALSDSDFLHDEGGIKDFREYAGTRKKEFGNPDVMYLMSGRDVFTSDEGQLTTRGLGIGYLAGVCSTAFVALGEDRPGFFTGLHTFTHELAHTLGATHDGQEADRNIRGHPSAIHCSWETGNIMSYINNGRSHYYFSRCSLEQMQFVIRSKGELCWAVTGTARTWDGVYAGMAVSFQTFCSNVLPGKENVTVDFVNQTNCKVRCKYVKHVAYQYNGQTYYYDRVFFKDADALDYMQCGQDMVCIRGECVPHHPSEKVPVVRTPVPATVPKTTTTSTTPTTVETSRSHYPATTSGCDCDCSSKSFTQETTPNTRRTPKIFNFRSKIRYPQH